MIGEDVGAREEEDRGVTIEGKAAKVAKDGGAGYVE